MMIQRILCPTDFSASSEAALHYAAALCKTFNAQLVILHVEEPPPTYVMGYPSPIEIPVGQAEHDPRLEGTEPAIPGVLCHRVRAVGLPADEIVEAASRHDCDLIVMGTHAYSGLTRLLLGSVAESVMRKASQPVLVVKHDVEPAELTPTAALSRSSS